ncbi:MAG: TonB-dependent receptor [Ginsengibacter sp.]
MIHLKRFLQTITICFLFTLSANAQNIEGKVADENGRPIESVSVVVKSSKAGTTTNSSGNFSIAAKAGDELSFTSSGYATQEVKIRDQSFLSIVMGSQITQLDQIVLLGSRSGGRVKLESPVPVDVISLSSTSLSAARPDLTSMLNYAAPSFNYNRQSGGDGADHIDLATLRGLGPDQTLVLVNGKRRHQTAFIALFGTRGRGNSGVDLNAIPEAAIDRVEILRDGASAQYGSDAIAGVINIILKKDVDKWQINVGGSGYYDKKFNPYFGGGLKQQYVSGDGLDGKLFNIGINRGFAIGKSKKGFISLSGNFLTQEKTFRQVLDTNLTNKNALPINTGRRANGDGSMNSYGGMLNMEAPIANTKTTFYSFGEYNYKSSEDYAYTRTFHGYNELSSARPGRFPTDANGNLVFIPGIMKSIPTPGDVADTVFNPLIETHVSDVSLAVGFKGTLKSDWNWDVSNTIGQNNFHYFGDKTLNASLGASGVNRNHFDDGGFKFLQNTTNVDFSKHYETTSGGGLDLSAGVEFRHEQYKIYAGEKDSYFNYDPTGEKAGGSQGFPGFQPADVVNASRNTEGLYVQTDLDVTSRLLTTFAFRVENYSDFGFLSTYKFATRYKVSPNFNIRGSISTGYRAPSLQQINFSNTFTNVQGGKSFDVKIAPNTSPITKAAGIPALKQETSDNVSLGFTAKPSNDFTITIDGYMIKMKDRIVLSGQFDNSNLVLAPILDSLGVAQAQFYANAVNTTNFGVDVILNYVKKWSTTNLNLLLAGNFQDMKINSINVPAALNESFGEQQAFYSQREEKFLKASAPPVKLGLTVDYGFAKRVQIGTHLTYFGKITLFGYGWDQSYPPLVTLDGTSTQVLEQFNYNGKLVTDVYASYKIAKSTTFYLGADNLFNIHPDLGYVPGAKMSAYDGEAGGPWDAVQMGTNGLRLFAKMKFSF